MGYCNRKGIECDCITESSVCNTDNCHRKLPDREEVVSLNKVKYFSSKGPISLQCEINDFISDKEVINVSFCVETGEYHNCYRALVAYKESR